jgi:hypothetical protein
MYKFNPNQKYSNKNKHKFRYKYNSKKNNKKSSKYVQFHVYCKWVRIYLVGNYHYLKNYNNLKSMLIYQVKDKLTILVLNLVRILLNLNSLKYQIIIIILKLRMNRNNRTN